MKPRTAKLLRYESTQTCACPAITRPSPVAVRAQTSALDERSRDIITRRWLAEDQEETLQVLADKYGVSAERIRQIEVKAMKQMRKVIEN